MAFVRHPKRGSGSGGTEEPARRNWPNSPCKIRRAWEFKWGSGRKARLPAPFAAAYPGTPFSVVTPDNFPAFLAPTKGGTP